MVLLILLAWARYFYYVASDLRRVFANIDIDNIVVCNDYALQCDYFTWNANWFAWVVKVLNGIKRCKDLF